MIMFTSLLLFHIGLTCHRSTLELNRVISSTCNSGIVVYALYQNLDVSNFFTRFSPMQPSFIVAVSNECIFYGIHLIEEIWIGDIVYVFHHLGALSLMLLALAYGYQQPIIVILGIINTTSPFLYISKWAHHNKKDVCAKIMFAVFAVVFFTFRIIAYPFVLKYTIIDAFNIPDVKLIPYITCNTILCSLYLLQLHWFQKIGNILCYQVLNKKSI